MVLTTSRVIWRYLRKVRVDSETTYGLGDNVVMAGHYLWGTLQAHRVMDDLLTAKLQQHLEVAPYITLYLFKHCSLRLEVAEINQKVEL